jgi:hypothetical protein
MAYMVATRRQQEAPAANNGCAYQYYYLLATYYYCMGDIIFFRSILGHLLLRYYDTLIFGMTCYHVCYQLTWCFHSLLSYTILTYGLTYCR